MDFGKKEKFNKSNNQDVIEGNIIEKKIPKNLKKQNLINQHPDYGVLSNARAFETRKHLFDLVKENNEEQEKKNLLKIKEEINEIIDNKKE